MALSELTDDIVGSMAVGATFSDFGGQINSLDFHRTEDLLITASEDDSIRLFDIANGKLLKTTYHKKHGADRICFTHHPHSVICSSIHNLDVHGESLRYLSMYDNRCLRYFKGHKERVVSLCMSPVNDSFLSGSLDHSVRIWDLRVNACQGILRLRGRPAVAYDQQGLVFAVAMEGGAIKLFDSRHFDKGPFETFLVGGDTAEERSGVGLIWILPQQQWRQPLHQTASMFFQVQEMEACMRGTSTRKKRFVAGIAT